MNLAKAHAKRSFFVVFLFIVLVTGLVNAGLFFGIEGLLAILPQGGTEPLKPGTWPELLKAFSVTNLTDMTALLTLLSARFTVWVIPFTAVFFLLFGLFFWLIMKVSVSGMFKDGNIDEKKEETDLSKKDFADKRLEQERNRRLFLHFLSVLQREGRLLDFFNEDLDLYDDDQIGAAVRSIHEDCKKSVDKYLSLKPVIDQNEGDEIDIEPGFDPDAVKLTGNVTGEPPFKGVLRHRGWKAGKKEMPKLSDVLDSSVIAPAEVEIE